MLRLSQTEVANEVGISRYTLAKYETGQSDIPITIAIKLNILFDNKEKS